MRQNLGHIGMYCAVTLLGSALLGGCASDKSTIAKATAANDQLKPAVMTDPDLSGYLQQIGDRIITSAKAYDAQGQGPASHKKGDSAWMFSKQMQFHLVNSKTINAFTTGGEHMYVYSALLQLCDNENELAAVMAHEFAHVYCRHVQQGTNRQTGMTVFAYGAQGAGYLYGGSANGTAYAKTAGTGAAAVAQFAGLSFTRGDEAEADKWGFKFYGRAGWDPAHFGDFFQKMIDKGFDTTPAMQSDHPTLKSRVEVARQELPLWVKENGDRYLKGPIFTDAQFAQIKAKAATLSASMPDDSATQQAKKLLASFSSCVAPVDQQEQAAAKQELLGPKK